MNQTYPGIGRTVVIDFGTEGAFGPFAAELSFDEAGESLTFLVTVGSLLGKTETLPYTASQIADGIWLVSWQELDGLTVVQVQDFASGRLSSAVTTPDLQFVALNGTVTLA